MKHKDENDMDYDEITLTIKLKAGDEVCVSYANSAGNAWKTSYKYDSYFTGSLLYKI